MWQNIENAQKTVYYMVTDKVCLIRRLLILNKSKAPFYRKGYGALRFA